LLIGFNYAQPFLISTAVSFVGNPEASKNYGYGLIGATIFIYLGMAVNRPLAQTRYQWHTK
jgi:hypothetical protein